jgi:hypothetical protein
MLHYVLDRQFYSENPLPSGDLLIPPEVINPVYNFNRPRCRGTIVNTIRTVTERPS